MPSPDILERKGYYNELTRVFEGIKGRREEIRKAVIATWKEKRQIEAEIVALQYDLEEVDWQLQESIKAREECEKSLARLEAIQEGGGRGAALALKQLEQAALTPSERAVALRLEFRDRTIGPRRPVSPHSSRKLGSSAQLHHEAVEVDDLVAVAAEGREVVVRCFRDPAVSARSGSPAVVYFHGEGFLLGDLDTHDWVCRSLAALAGAVVVSVDYRRPPEDPFPAAFEDAYAALTWVARGGLGAVPSNLAVAGDSAGGGLAVACCLRARDEQGPAIAVQMLFYPWLDLRPESPSMRAGSDDVEVQMFLEELAWFREVYAPPPEDAEGYGTATEPAEPPEPAASEQEQEEEFTGEEDFTGDPVEEWPPEPLERPPFAWTEDLRVSPLSAASLAGLPRTFIAYAGDDPLAPDSVRLAERLRAECGPEAVHTMHVEGPLGHGFVKHSSEPEAHAVVAAAAAFADAALRSPSAQGS